LGRDGHLRLLARFGTTVSAAVLTTPASDADIETTVVVVTVPPVTLNVALVDPAATATLPGMRTADRFAAFNTTWDPPLGAAPLRVTVPIVVWPVPRVEMATVSS